MLLYIDNNTVVPFENEQDAKDWGIKGKPNLEVTQEEFDAAGGYYRIEKGKIILGKSPEMIKEEKATEVRRIRDQYLTETDRYVLIDFPFSEKEKQQALDYRKYLRDLPQDKNFPEVTVLSFEDFLSKK